MLININFYNIEEFLSTFVNKMSISKTNQKLITQLLNDLKSNLKGIYFVKALLALNKLESEIIENEEMYADGTYNFYGNRAEAARDSAIKHAIDRYKQKIADIVKPINIPQEYKITNPPVIKQIIQSTYRLPPNTFLVRK